MNSRPNLLFILSDQHRYCSLPGVDGCEVLAPNLERLQGMGAGFTNCYSNYPVCAPARGMLLSGQFPSASGVTNNLSELAPSPASLGNLFAQVGYRTCYIGKWRLLAGPPETIDGNDRYIPPGAGRHGFERMDLWSETNRRWDSLRYLDNTPTPVRANGYNATLMTDEALDFLRGRDRDRPFLLFLSLNPPHPPLDDAPPQSLERYAGRTLSLRPNVPQPLASGARSVPAGAHRNHVTMTLQQQLAQYYAHISAIDAEIGRLLTALEETDALGNTLVVYTSDHGDMLGSHGLLRKGYFLRESSQVPLIISWPGTVDTGQSRNLLIGLIDMYPTLLGLCGLPVPGSARGLDLSAAILAGSHTGASHVLHFSTHHEDLEFREGSRGLRTARHLYFTDGNSESLFDTLEDPFETRNLAHDPACAHLKATLAGCIRHNLPPEMTVRQPHARVENPTQR